jgi:long-chain acyl-CoA synthetase
MCGMADMFAERSRVIAELTAAGGAFEIVTVPVRGLPMRAYSGGPRSLREVLELSRGYADREFLVYQDERWTYEQHYQVAAALARRLRDRHGVAKGDRVAIAMRNYPEWAPAFWACQAIGAVAVPLNAWWTGAELEYALRDSGAVVLIADAERYERLAGLTGGLDALRTVVVVREAGQEDPGGGRFRPAFASGAGRLTVEAWQDVLADVDPAGGLPEAEIDIDDDTTIMYTSGTTGRPKGAISTHRNHCTTLVNTVLAGLVNATLAGTQPDLSVQPAALQTFPYFHIGGLSLLYLHTALGAKVVLMYKWDVDEAVMLAGREGVTSFVMVPMLLRQFLDHPQAADVTSLLGIAAGAAPVPPDLIRNMEEKYERKVSPANAYGLTETTSAVIANSAEMYFTHPDSVGLPAPGTELRVVDAATGADVTPGDVGELWIYGPNVVRGYWNDPAGTAAAFTEGWFHTGDLARIDGDGLVYVVDRLKDIVIRGGENVYCAEVEAALYEHPDVADVAIIGVPHRSLGEEVAAVIQLRDGAGTGPDELRAHVAARLAAFKVPSRVFFRTAPLPRNATGKLLKRQLRDEYGLTAG